MITTAFHPAILELLRLQSRGRRRRIVRKLQQPRRLVLSAVACVLAIAWLGNAALTVWFREAAAPETLAALLSLGLVIYAAWHLAKAAFFRPESPFDWTPDERELLAAMPLLPRDLVAYQVASVTVTTVLKTVLFTMLLLPDLQSLALGFTGMLLAMLVLELLRMAVDIATWGMSHAAYLVYRTVVVAALVAGGLAAGAVAVREKALARINPGEGLLDRLLDMLVELDASEIGYAALPFRPIIRLIVADRITVANIGLATASAVAVAALAAAVIGLYATTVRRVVARERRSYDPNIHSISRSSLAARPSLGRSVRRPPRLVPRWGGVGALAWRQLVGARRQWGSVLTALIAPAVLAFAPCFVIADPEIAVLSTAGTLAFYTFLLLPTAVRFDFRRDLDRLAILKGLPITPAAAVIGQTLVPVLIATVFQSAVLAFALAARSLPPEYLAMALLIMVPFNLLVFALDNLIYLLYPYRVQQEGLEIFLRTMLTFTGKGLLFAAGLGVMSVWGFAAAALARVLSNATGLGIDPLAVFTAGMIAGPAGLAAIVLYALSQTYRHLDPVEDVPH